MTLQQIEIFTSADGQAQISVALEHETVWLSQAQMGSLFGTTPENVDGYTLNQKRLQEKGIEFNQVVSLLNRTLSNQGLIDKKGQAVAAVIGDYARSWSLLQKYDEQSLQDVTTKQSNMQQLTLEDALPALEALKSTLIDKGKRLHSLHN